MRKGFRELFDSFYTWSLKNPLVVHFNCGPQLLVFIRMRYMATAWLFERQKQDYMHIDSYISRHITIYTISQYGLQKYHVGPIALASSIQYQ